MKSTSSSNKIQRDHAKIYRIYKAVAIILTFATILLTTVTVCTRANADSRYVSSSPIAILLYAVVAVGVLFSLSAAFVLKKSANIFESKTNAVTKAVSFLPVAGAIICFFQSLLSMSDRSSGATPIIILLTAAFAVLYHLSFSLSFPPALKLISGYAQMILCIVVIAQLYLDFSVELNSTAKLLLQFSLVAMMLNTVSDLKILIGKPSASQYMMSKSLLLCLAPTSFVLIAMMQISSPSLFSNSSYLIYSVYCFAESINAAVGLFSSGLSTPKSNG